MTRGPSHGGPSVGPGAVVPEGWVCRRARAGLPSRYLATGPEGQQPQG